MVNIMKIYQKLHCTGGFFENAKFDMRFLNTRHREGVFRHFLILNNFHFLCQHLDTVDHQIKHR